MRKYYRAALALIASISLVALLFYRHEYNKLRYVLEVFNYFGNPDIERINCTDSSSIVTSKLYNQDKPEYYDNFNEPIPMWQRLNDEIYVYSAYRTNDGEIRAVGLARSRSSNLSLSCGIFYENEAASIAGNFTYKLIESSSSERIDLDKRRRSTMIYQGYQFVCNYGQTENKKFIDFVKFSTYSDIRGYKESMVMLPVREYDDGSNEQSNNEISGLCVAPSNSRPMLNTDVINFISFHSILGIENFIVYDFGIAPRLNVIMRRISPINVTETSKLVTYTTIPWNFPFTQISHDIVRSIVQTDCLYRTYGKIQIIATLTLDEYIITKYHRTVAKLFRDIDKTGYAADRYRVSSLNFCIDRTDKHNVSSAEPNILANNRKIDANRSVYIYRRSSNSKKKDLIDDGIVTRETTTDVIVANRYDEHCARMSELEPVSPEDRYVGKFSKIIKNSTISKLFHLNAR